MLRLGLGFVRLRRLRRDSSPAQLDGAPGPARRRGAARGLRWTTISPSQSRSACAAHAGPPSLASLSIEARRAVLCLTAARGAARLAVDRGEDLMRAVMWFHPGVWGCWITGQPRQTVDALAVRRMEPQAV
jgi:hypothetical protein